MIQLSKDELRAFVRAEEAHMMAEARLAYLTTRRVKQALWAELAKVHGFDAEAEFNVDEATGELTPKVQP